MVVRGGTLATTLALVLMLVPGTMAGTADAPEITDAAADVTFESLVPGCAPVGCQAAPQFVDLTKGWVESTATEVIFSVTVAGNENANAYGDAQFDVHFTAGATDYVAGFHVAIAEVESGVPGDGAVTPTGVASAAAYGTAVMTITVPRTAIGNPSVGATLSKLYVTSLLNLGEVDEKTWSDRAPSGSAYGTDYVFPAVSGGGATSAPTIRQNITTPELAFLSGHVTASNQTYVLNWTNAFGQVRITTNATVAAGRVTLTVNDTATHTAFTKRLNATAFGPFNATVNPAAKGAWKITVRFEGFKGHFALSIANTTATGGSGGSGGAAGGGSGSGSGSSSDTGAPAGSGGDGAATSSSGKKTPVPLVVAIAAVALALAARRRMT